MTIVRTETRLSGAEQCPFTVDVGHFNKDVSHGLHQDSLPSSIPHNPNKGVGWFQ